MKYFCLILAFIIVVSCKTELNQGITDKLAFSVSDTLEKYSKIDSKIIPYKIRRTGITIDTSSNRKVDKEGNPIYIEFSDTIDAKLYIGKVNNVHFGFTLREGKITFYQKVKNVWTISDTTDFFEPVILKQMDLNGDGYNDLRISYLHNRENGDLLTCVFLFDKSTKMFKLNKSFGQANVEYDSKNKFVKFWIGCIKGQSGVKWKGAIVKNKLIADSTVTFALDPNKMVGILKLYKGSNGAGYNPIKTETGNPDSLWNKFNKTFWNHIDKNK